MMRICRSRVVRPKRVTLCWDVGNRERLLWPVAAPEACPIRLDDGVGNRSACGLDHQLAAWILETSSKSLIID